MTEFPTPKTAFSRQNPFPARLRENRRLNRQGSKKDTRHIVIELGSAGPTYTCGDSLGVFPRNPDSLVCEFIETLGLQNDAALHEAIATSGVLNRVRKKFVRAVAEKALGQSKQRFQEIIADDKKFDHYIFDRDVIDVLRDAPGVHFEPTDIPGLLNTIAPRLYSIASSPDHRPGEAHLTVALVQYASHGRQKQGLASGYLAHLADESTVAVYVQPTRHFHLPPADRDMIMVGPGTGVAPFRGFLQHRAVHGHSGRNWLFFGDQHANTDFLYEEEFLAARKSRLLHKLSTAFSRDQAEKLYVQHRMEEEGAELWRWLEEGAFFYVCGDAKRMAKDVHASLVTIVAKHGGKTLDQADEWVSETLIKNEKRYLRDVY
jgi:sulfite reductase (NADPH) flavoprotein alpha-component